jgi:hypothetical protein
MKNQNIFTQDHPQILVKLTPAATAKAKADAFALAMKPTIDDLQAAGIVAPSAIAAALTRNDVKTARGGQWNTTLVLNLARRLTALTLTEVAQ